MLRPKRTKRAPARKPFLTEGAPTRNDLRPEGARLRERLNPPLGFGEERKIPPQSVLDAEAERKLTGGFSRKANRYCEDCGVLKTKLGGCWCPDEDAAVKVADYRTHLPKSALAGMM